MPDLITAGIFVGGASRRMGGAPKGLLLAPDTGEPLVCRAARLAYEAGLSPCLVGRAEAYRERLPSLPVIADDPEGCGPLGGLRGLLRARTGRVIAVACDMPFVTAEVLRALRDAPDAAVVAPRAAPDGPWEPLLARYDSARVLPALDEALASGGYGLQAILNGLGAAPITLPEACLRDWDSPADLATPATRPTPARRLLRR